MGTLTFGRVASKQASKLLELERKIPLETSGETLHCCSVRSCTASRYAKEEERLLVVMLKLRRLVSRDGAVVR